MPARRSCAWHFRQVIIGSLVAALPGYRGNAAQLHAFHLDPELAEGLTTVKVERGIPKSEQVRRAIRMWLESEGVLKP